MSEPTTIVSRDGTRLALHHWAAEGTPRAALLVVHGYFEHGGRYAELAADLNGHGIDVWAVDLRGHGRADGRRGYIRSFDEYLDDLDTAVAEVSAREPRAPRFVLGQSMGGLVTLVWAARRPFARDVRGIVLTNPYLVRAMTVPGWKLGAARVMATLRPTFSLPAALDTGALSHDPAKNEAYREDALIFTSATAGWFAEMNRVQDEVGSLRTIPVPVLWIVGDADRIALPQASLEMFERLQAPEKTLKVLPGQYHEVLNERERTETYAAIAAWIAAHAGP